MKRRPSALVAAEAFPDALLDVADESVGAAVDYALALQLTGAGPPQRPADPLGPLGDVGGLRGFEPLGEGHVARSASRSRASGKRSLTARMTAFENASRTSRRPNSRSGEY